MTNLFYKNRGSETTRNLDITDHLFYEISEAIELVFGCGFVGHIYSGGQPRRGSGGKRTGTIRHDDFGEGGRAADVYIYDQNMNRLTGASLAPLVQYWLASELGGVGVEMGRGGIHLDEWAKPPQRGGMFWYYKGTNKSNYNKAVKAGIDSIMPPVYEKPAQATLPWLISAFAALFRRKEQ